MCVSTALPCCSREAKRLAGELADSRADHAATRCTLYGARQAAAEHERQRTASEAKQKQLQVCKHWHAAAVLLSLLPACLPACLLG